MLLIRSGEIEGMPIARVISDFEFGIPVYVDERNRFLKDNTSLSASDSSLHSLFVDGKGKSELIVLPQKNPMDFLIAVKAMTIVQSDNLFILPEILYL